MGELQAIIMAESRSNKVSVFFIVSAPPSAKLKPEFVKKVLRMSLNSHKACAIPVYKHSSLILEIPGPGNYFASRIFHRKDKMISYCYSL
jgi:hypothetical protein